MYAFKRHCQAKICSSPVKFLTTATALMKSHYDSLGITPNATHSDIKSAYYKLSMLYHPDKNKGSPDALTQFRAITEAYEVLGNFRLRKLYDKGILHTAGPQFTARREDPPPKEDDATTKFYKSRQYRSRPPTPSGRTPIYDFDEWARNHYGDVLARRMRTKLKYETKIAREISDKFDKQNETVAAGAICVILFILYFTYNRDEDINRINISHAVHQKTEPPAS